MSREFQDWMEKQARLDYIKPDEIPNIELYMDQVTTFMESQLAGTKRTPADKIMTKTMINNYTKNKLLPAPEKKKYSKDHMLMLIFIFYFKSIMSISDLQEILTPLSEYCFGKKETSENKPNLSAVYKETAMKSFENVEGAEGDFLKKLSFITLLSHDIFVRKQMIETMVDELKNE